jgi:outer membrane protein OmpA-like peptidoglycan-associated protein
MSALIHGVLVAIAAMVPMLLVHGWLEASAADLAAAQPQAVAVATAAVAEEGYCTPSLKQIVRRVAGACGLIQQEGRGCQPADAAKVVALSGEDFNALFAPLSGRVHIVEYDANSVELDDAAKDAIGRAWADRRGASFFFVVARASPDGKAEVNQQLSEGRAKAVLTHLKATFADPDIEKQVGLLWLGEEFAQLPESFCGWQRSRAGLPCDAKTINRSAFIAWIDCAI